jgi:hypothetical protein
VRQRWRFGMAIAVMAAAVLASSSPAGAEMEGPCTAQATFRNGTKDGGSFTVDASSTDVVKVPLSDTVDWTGSIAVPAVERPIEGEVTLQMPWPFGAVSLHSWGGDTTAKVQGSGTEEYDLPSFVPRGVEMTVEAVHRDAATCRASLRIEVEGSATDSPLVWPSLGLTAASLALLGLAGRPVVRRPRPAKGSEVAS